MDPLFQKAKELYPNASDDEIMQNIQKIRSEVPPGTSDDEIIQSASKLKGMTDDGSFQKQMVKQNLMQKYNMGEYSPEARQKLVDANASAASPIAAGFAGFGAGLRGGDVGSAFKGAMDASQSKTKSALEAFDKNREGKMKDFAFERDVTTADKADQISAEMKDPNSDRSKAVQQMLIEDYGMDPATAGKLTAEQAEQRIPSLKAKIDRQMREREFDERMKDRQLQRENMNANRDMARADKQTAQAEKKKATLTEVEDRRMNIEDNLTQLENMIKDKGTYEMFGSHNADMDRRVEMIATDMAKLADPNSVARPSEVEAFKKGLIQSNATGMRNSTALDILKNFRNEVNKRTENAYKIRGIDNPGAQKTEETKTVGNKTYRKVEGGWEEVE